MTEESTRLHIYWQFAQQRGGLERSSALVIEDENGQKVSLPETMTLGEYLFRIKLRAFHQGGVMEWPENKENNNFFQRVRNMQQGGDEGFSLAKVRASMAGAQKRVKEQTESMALVKAEYDALRHEWEDAHLQQEKERLLMIEQKNLQETEKILAEKISYATIIHERLVVLRQNPDYRELRHLQGELIRLEESFRESESKLSEITLESHVDWAVIEGLRGECMEWAYFQEEVDRFAAEIQMLAQKIREVQDSMQTSGYQGLSENEVQRLQRAEEERYAAQKELEPELENLTIVKSELVKLEKTYAEENAKLQALAVMAGVTEAAEIKIMQRERNLAHWQRSKLGSFIDRVLQDLFGVKSIGKRLTLRFARYYQNYHASNFMEFTSQLKEFRDLRPLVEQLRMDLEPLQEKVRWEEKLLGIVNSRNKILKRAFSTAKVADFPAWLSGWEDHLQRKEQLAQWYHQRQLELEQQRMVEQKMAASAEQLREKLENWGTLATDRDEVLAAVLKVAKQLRAKDVAEKEVTVFSQKFYNLLGDRTIEQLAEILEPLADLEREASLSDEDGLAELTAKQKERVEICRQREEVEKSLQNGRKFPLLSVLEKKIEKLKQQWIAFEDLRAALEDSQALLEASWQEWKTKYAKILKEEKQWILSQMSSSSAKEVINRDVTEGKRDYFAYRMAVAQLALHDNTEVPLVFSVGDMTEEQCFWEEVSGYLRKLSLSRQVIFCTTNSNLLQKLAANGWQSLVV